MAEGPPFVRRLYLDDGTVFEFSSQADGEQISVEAALRSVFPGLRARKTSSLLETVFRQVAREEAAASANVSHSVLGPAVNLSQPDPPYAAPPAGVNEHQLPLERQRELAPEPPISSASEPRPDVPLPPPPPQVQFFDAGELWAWRDQAQALQPVDAQQLLSPGWRVAEADPNQLLTAFPRVRLREGWKLGAYLYVDELGHGAQGLVFSVPEGERVPHPSSLPTGEQPWQLRLPREIQAEPMWALTGDGTPESWMQASILRRELGSFGAIWHAVDWDAVTVLDAPPPEQPQDQANPLAAYSAGLEWIERPTDWRPRVSIEGDSIEVSFVAYHPIGQRRLLQISDRYTAHSLVPADRRERVLASSPGGISW